MKEEKLKQILRDIEINHNHSLYLEILERNKNNLNAIAISYRGNEISYEKLLLELVPQYVKAFQKNGIGKNSEIPICVSNIPEFVVIVLAASYVGAKINVFGTEFEDSYKTEIINECNSPLIFVSDDNYGEIKDSISASNTKSVVMLSLTDSLKNNIDPYYEIDKDYYDFSNRVEDYKKDNSNIFSQSEFIKSGENEILNKPVEGSLNDIFSTTYSSGSTNSIRPKGIVHTNKSYITMGRSHDTDLSNAPSMHGLRVLAMIPTHSNTNLMSNITDTLIQGSCVIPEPINHPDFLLNSFLINKPNFVTATRSLIIKAAKSILYDKRYESIKMPYLFALFSVGEATTDNEEKFINKALRKSKAGKLWFDKTEKKFFGKLPVSFPLSIAGGDCEHGGIFYTMFKSWNEKKERLIGHLLKDERMGMSTHQMVSCVILDEEGNKVENGQLGRLYATSPCNMYGYRNNADETAKFFKVIDGQIYGDCSVLATKDDFGRIDMKGRINKKLPMYINKLLINLSDTILKDTKNILSCEIIPYLVNDDYVFIAHIELQPDKMISTENVLKNVEQRCISILGEKVASKIYYRMHDFYECYPVTGCGKRSYIALEAEGITEKCFKPVLSSDGIVFKNYYELNDSEYAKSRS